MPTTTVDTTGLDRLRARFQRLGHIDCTELMIRWTNILDEQNRAGILAGTDGAGNPLAPVTYRPRLKTGQKPAALTVEQRLGQNPRLKRGVPRSIGSGQAHAFNNLTSAEYRLLDGPPLAPRRQFSRVITNYRTDYAELRPGFWACTYWWDDVVSKKGVSFLRFHFDGIGQRRRDLRGVRPEAKEKARAALRAFMISEIQSAG